MGNEEKLRPGVRVTDYPTTPLLLEKTPKKHNVLIGDDAMQVRFAEQYLSSYHHVPITCQLIDALHDDHILGQEEPKLYRVDRASQMDISQQVRSRIGIWSLDMIEKGSAGANAIVREAAKLMGMGKPTTQVTNHVANEIVKNLNDIKAAIWQAAYLLTAAIPEKKAWPQPWENYLTWLPPGEDVQYRLNTLYWTMIEYTFAAENDEKGFKKTGRQLRPREFKHLASLILPKDRVVSTLEILSAWREKKADPYICALKIAKVWERQ